MEKVKVDNKLKEYIEFKEVCIENKIFDIDEIRWLYDKLILGDLIK